MANPFIIKKDYNVIMNNLKYFTVEGFFNFAGMELFAEVKNKIRKLKEDLYLPPKITQIEQSIQDSFNFFEKESKQFKSMPTMDEMRLNQINVFRDKTILNLKDGNPIEQAVFLYKWYSFDTF